jgi:hypothetical protein
MDPARMFRESLIPRPELENDQDPSATSARNFAVMHSGVLPQRRGNVRP